MKMISLGDIMSMMRFCLVFPWCCYLLYCQNFYAYTFLYILIVRTGLEGPGLTVSQKVWYCIATVGGQYIWARLQSFSAFRRWGDTEQVCLFSCKFNDGEI